MTTTREIDLNVLRQLAGLSTSAGADGTPEALVTSSSVPPTSASPLGHTQTIHSAVEKWEASYATMKEVQQNLVAAYRDLASMEHG